MSFSGRTSPSTRKELKKLCAFFDNIDMNYTRDTRYCSHPGTKLQALQKPVGYDIYAGPNCIIDTKYDVIQNAISVDKNRIINAKQYVDKMIL
jgi:hypothetical protein